MNLMLFGPQGSGKGTQSELLAKEYQLTIIDMGSILRAAAKERTKRGKLINSWVNQKGKLLPDGIAFEIFSEHLKNLGNFNGLILDGYPRSVKQYFLIEDNLSTNDKFVDLAIYLDIPEQLTIERLSNRLVCTRCKEIYNLKTNPPPQENTCKCGGKLIRRQDDQPEAIKTRLKLYHQVTEPLLQVLDKQGMFVKIEGAQTPEQVFKDIKKILQEKELV